MKHAWKRRLVAFFWVLTAAAAQCLDFWDNTPPEILAHRLADAMSDEELASQVFLWGYPTDAPPSSFLKSIARNGLGGVKLFGWNAPSTPVVAKAVRSLQKAAAASRFHVPLFVATDQEGGWVRHIKGDTSATSGNLALGSEHLAWDSYETGLYLGKELARLGVNMNFAPSVDLYIDPEANVIGPRSFSQDPVEVGWLAVAFVRGEMDAGVIPTAKHFPGHGNTSQDSHGGLPIIQDSWNVLKNREMIPYKMLFREGLPAVMTGHLAFPQISGNLLPASLNPKLNRDLLRDKLGFQGLIITDDLFMVGAKPQDWTATEPSVRGLEAGNDLLLISQPGDAQEADRKAVVRKMAEDPAFRSQVRDSVIRSLLVKLRFLKGPRAVTLAPDPANLGLPDARAQAFFFGQAIRSTVLLKGDGLPWKDGSGEGLLVVTPYDAFYEAVLNRYPGARKIEYDYDFFGSSKAIQDEILREAPEASRVLVLVATPGAYDYLKILEPWKAKTTVVCSLSPVPIRNYPWVKTAIAVFGTDPDAYDAAVGVLDGDVHPTARLPLNFPGLPVGGGF